MDHKGISTALMLAALVVTLFLATAADAQDRNMKGMDVGQPSAAPPANDNMVNALSLNSSISGVAGGTNVEATLETGEPVNNGNDNTVWYSWTAPSNLSMTIETYNDGFTTLTDTVLAVYTGATVNTLTAVAGNDDVNGSQNRYSRVTFIATAGTLYRIQIGGFSSQEGTFNFVWGVNRAESNRQLNFDYIGKSDLGIFRPPNGVWYIRLSNSTPEFKIQQWGTSNDILMPQDYDGDGKTDLGVWRAENGTFFIFRSVDSTFTVGQWGTNGDKPVQGDFDGDDKGDLAVFRPSTGDFYVRRSTNLTFLVQHWGQNGDIVACGDYDGDGKTDFGVRRPGAESSTFYILRSSDGGFIGRQFGFWTDIIYPGDFDGDGKNDVAVYRGGTVGYFYYLNSSDGQFKAIQWGTTFDRPITGDYIDSGASDLCVWRASPGTFYCYGDGGSGTFLTYQLGQSGDYPIGASNTH